MTYLKIIPDWAKKKHTCHFCGTNKSVKYKVKISDPDKPGEFKIVPCCNMCSLMHKIHIMDE